MIDEKMHYQAILGFNYMYGKLTFEEFLNGFNNLSNDEKRKLIHGYINVSALFGVDFYITSMMYINNEMSKEEVIKHLGISKEDIYDYEQKIIYCMRVTYGFKQPKWLINKNIK